MLKQVNCLLWKHKELRADCNTHVISGAEEHNTDVIPALRSHMEGSIGPAGP